MPTMMTLLHLAIAVLTFLFGSGAGTLLSGERLPIAVSIPMWQGGGSAVAGEAQLLVATESDQLGDQSLLSAAELTTPALAVSAAQIDPDEPLDGPLDQDDETLDAPIVQVADVETQEPLDAPLADDVEVLDAPLDEDELLDAPIVEEVEVLDAPIDDSIAVLPPVELEPLDVPIVAEVVDQPVAKLEPLDVAVDAKAVVAAPVAKPAAAPVAVAKPKAVPVAVVKDPKVVPPPKESTLVTSVRKKGDPESRVVVTAGQGTIPVEYAGCGVAVAAGRATVGSDCDEAPALAAHQPAIPRSPGSTALISTENPSRITSRRDGIQIGDYPKPTLGDSIATTVRAAIFPEDVIVPEVLIVPGELVVAGNDAREDPIVLWRSELDQAAIATGMPVEILATAIRATSNGEVHGQSASGGVGLMFVPVEQLIARGVPEDHWYDPATNIRIGAEILAEAATAANLPTEAALTSYLATTCGAPNACVQPESAHVHDWIVHYRLRMTHEAGNETYAAAAEPAISPDWPFTEQAEAEAAVDPFARIPSPFKSDQDDQSDDLPAIRVGGTTDAEEPESTSPASRVWVDRD